ncbi:hypothetical protein [Auritidibacter sp. NML120636]|uniref:hypothetical protein n=1 Tax=Auritidibacter sp. NML120636 TaxID=2170743 RepID=UPI0018F1E29C|nr:hypothetical protein [Auritidibacter sp. NML120636]
MDSIVDFVVAFYSLNLAQEIPRDMTRRTTIGGTPHQSTPGLPHRPHRRRLVPTAPGQGNSQPAKTVTTNGPPKTNPSYQGTVTFRSVTDDGTHQPLVDATTSVCVHANLDANNTRGEQSQKYHHYRKGTLFYTRGAKLMIKRP